MLGYTTYLDSLVTIVELLCFERSVTYQVCLR